MRILFSLIFSIVFLSATFLLPHQSMAQPDLKKFKTTEGGIYYRFYKRNKKGPKANLKDVVQLNLSFKTEKDSVIFSTLHPAGKHIEFTIKEPTHNGDIMEGFLMMSPGDSVVFYVPIDSMYKEFRPDFAKTGTYMKYEVRLKRIFTPEEYDQWKNENRKESIETDLVTIKNYLQEKGLLDSAKLLDNIYMVWLGLGSGHKVQDELKLTFHYKGWLLGGKEIDNSYQRKQPINFVIGNGEVIEGWDLAAKHMREGDSVRIFIPSALAYGEKGAGYVIPPNAILQFDMKLLDVYDEIIRARDDKKQIIQYIKDHGINANYTSSGVLYSIKEPGEGEFIQDGQQVKVHYTGKIITGQVFETTYNTNIDMNEPFTFTLGYGQVIKGWEVGFKKFKKGTIATLFIPSLLAYGEKGTDDVPPDAILIYEIEVIDVK
jgi:FKBP-type peptidyl-prolyl cis-trans isomerase